MFDLIGGLPVHILVLHAFVVVGPLAALATLAFVARPAWREALRWPVAVAAVVTGISGWVTKESGEKLAARLVPDLEAVKGHGSTDPQVQAVLDHAQSGDLAAAVGLLFMVVVAVSVLWGLREEAAITPLRGVVRTTALALVVISSIALLGTVYFAGDSGASAAWRAQVAATSTPNGN